MVYCQLKPLPHLFRSHALTENRSLPGWRSRAHFLSHTLYGN